MAINKIKKAKKPTFSQTDLLALAKYLDSIGNHHFVVLSERYIIPNSLFNVLLVNIQYAMRELSLKLYNKAYCGGNYASHRLTFKREERAALIAAIMLSSEIKEEEDPYLIGLLEVIKSLVYGTPLPSVPF